jgi:CRISPR-associated protein Csm3
MSAHTAQTELKLIGKLILEGVMHCETGLHVGAGKGSLEIGGSDNPVVKDSFGRPYVPGSSLRGRIRSLLEQATGLAVPSELVFLSKKKGQEVRIHQSDRPDDEICLLFGRSPGRMEKIGGDYIESNHASPARLSVFDAPLDIESITQQMRENLDDELTEVKSENSIDRVTSQANIRTLERVPAGARFHVRFVVDMLCPEDAPLLALLVQGLRLLEDDALGGGGSRGSGRVRFANMKIAWRGKDYYAAGAAESDIVPAGDLAALQAKVHEIGAGFLA